MDGEKRTGSLTLEGNALVPTVNGSTDTRRVSVCIENGTITAVGAPGGADLSFGDRYLLVPGFVDMHVHCREDPSGAHNYKEDFHSAGEAALRGGVVAMADMPNNPEPPNSPERLAAKQRLADQAPVDVLCYAVADPRTGPFAGDVPYKIYLDESTGGTDEAMRRLCAAFRGRWLSVHAEDPGILTECAGAPTHEERRPPAAEVEAVGRLIRCLSEDPGLHIHICHVSLGQAADLIAGAKAEGLPISSEVCCHHLLFDGENFPAGLSEFRNVNPPLRTAGDRAALLDALSRGVIDTLATDHAPHLPEEKRAGASGFPGLDIYGPFVTQLARDLPLSRVVAVTAGFAGRFWNRFTGETFGTITPGAVGSITVLGPLPWKGIRKDSFSTRCGWSPYVGQVFPGTVHATIVRGQLAYREGTLPWES